MHYNLQMKISKWNDENVYENFLNLNKFQKMWLYSEFILWNFTYVFYIHANSD